MKNVKLLAGMLALLMLCDAWISRHSAWLPTDRSLNPVLVMLAGIVLIVLWQVPRYQLAISMVAAGFLDNIVSYLLYGRFMDAIGFKFWYSSPADLIITVGCVWLVVLALIPKTAPKG